MNTKIRNWAAHTKNFSLVLYDFTPPEIGADDVEITVEHCGPCHSDISMIDNEWGLSQYPLVPGHEVVGIVVIIQISGSGLGLSIVEKIAMHSNKESEDVDCC